MKLKLAVLLCGLTLVVCEITKLSDASQVKLGLNDLDDATIATFTGPHMTKIQCASLALQELAPCPLFCITSDKSCLLVNITVLPHYDNTEGGPALHTCYTTIAPLFDRGK